MISGLAAAPMRWAKLAALPLAAILIGVAIAVASSPASVTGSRRTVWTPPASNPTPGPTPSPPTVTESGVLGKAAVLEALGSSLVAAGPGIEAGSTDGKNWTTLVAPSGATSIVMDLGNPLHGIAGGASVQSTTDGGKTWTSAKARPPGSGPYQVIRISPFDNEVWFLLHQNKLLRTRDGSASWRELAGLPSLIAPVLVPGHVSNEFFLASGGRVFELVDNGQQIVEQPPLPSGIAVTELAAVGGGLSLLLARGSDHGLYLLKGSTWSRLSGGLGGPIAAGANDTLVVGDGGARLGSPGSASYSTDEGATCRPGGGLPSDQSVEAIAGQPASTTFYAYCYGGDVYASTDAGRTWNLLSGALRSRSE
jgi:photosystem II stability/assembly factor-like uncharacterized protein